MYENLTTFIEKLECLENGSAGKVFGDAIMLSNAVDEFVKITNFIVILSRANVDGQGRNL